jgi:hypothetical protein
VGCIRSQPSDGWHIGSTWTNDDIPIRNTHYRHIPGGKL